MLTQSIHYVLGTGLCILFLQQLKEGTLISPILPLTKLRHRKVKHMPKVT